MASISASLSHPLSSFLRSEPISSSSSSSSLLLRSPLNFSPPPSRKSPHSGKGLIVRGGGDAFLDLELPSNKGKPLGKPEKKKRPARLKPRRISPPLPVPDHILKPPYVGSGELPDVTDEHQIHDAEGLVKMRAACKLAARVLEYAGTLVRPSVTTNEIDEAVHQMIIDAGAYPSPLGYGGFPKSVCTSVNECMCHGIPDSRELRDGDIINIDVTVYLDGYHGDTAKTYLVGEVSNEMKALVKVTEGCLARGISFCKAGVPYRVIGNKISEAAEALGFNVADRFVGHGVGTVFHSEPLIYHTRNKRPGTMIEGETFTIEPILTMGTTECKTWDDNWTILTLDHKPAAQFEHTILITKTGAEILTEC